jgi:hypothetical protein
MNLRKMTLTLIPLAALAVLAMACNGDDAVLSTTSSLITGSDDGSPTTTVTVPQDQTSTTLVGQVVASYEIVAREPGADGETVYVVIPAGTYTNVDIENFIGELYDSGTATYGAEIFDDAAAATAYLKVEADRTPEEVTLIEQHHLASLIGGTTIRFQGPFADAGEYVLGS